MLETRAFKTRLCALYERGRCGRETCTFAHGDSELQRVPGSFNDRPINRDSDLRSKLTRKHSPFRRCSPKSDAKGSHAYKRFSPSHPSKRRKVRTHEHVGGPSDFSGGFKSLDESADRRKDESHVFSDSRKILRDELKLVQYEVDVLFSQKSQMEIELEERVQEADRLSSRIRDLEAQLSEEKDKSKRVNSKIKKFIRAHVHHSQLQDEIKRSQIQLEQLVRELGVDALPIGACEDKLNVKSISDEEILDLKDSASPVRKQLHSSSETSQKLKTANSTRGHGARAAGSWRNSSVRFDGHCKDEMENRRKDNTKPSNGSKSRLRNNASEHFDPLDKLKTLESNPVTPSTSMAAHAVDDFELMEAEEEPGLLGTPKNVDNSLPSSLPPLPSVSQNNYWQYAGDDENVDVDGPEEEHEEVDIVLSVNDRL